MNDQNQDSRLAQNRSIVHGFKMMTFWIGISWIWLLDDFQDRKRAYSVILTEPPTLPVYHVVNTKMIVSSKLTFHAITLKVAFVECYLYRKEGR